MSAAASSSLLLSKAARFLAARAPGSFAKPLAVGSLIRPLRTLRTPLITAAGMDGAERGSASKAGISVSSGGGSGHTFPISPSTVLKIQKGDITVWSVDGSTDAILEKRKDLAFVSIKKYSWSCPMIHHRRPRTYCEYWVPTQIEDVQVLVRRQAVVSSKALGVSAMALRTLFTKKSLTLVSAFRSIAVASTAGDRRLGSGLSQARGLTVAALPDLPYDYGALEPAISGEIMRLHHQKHHQAYVTNYNNALEQLEAAIAKGDATAVVRLQSAIKFNGGGSYASASFLFHPCVCSFWIGLLWLKERLLVSIRVY
ncbi:hypothetical protein BHE74_00033836 [Ensete ventricosum]|nr:hypothetical protein BHE74_00033836 [Ensete ventricosum]